jgi:hypothetical protein
LNKDFDTSICIGPTAAAALDAGGVDRLATVTLRGHSTEIDVFTVAAWRAENKPSAAARTASEPRAVPGS